MIVLFSPRYAYGIAKWLRMVLSWVLPPLLLYTVYLICTAPLDRVQGWAYLWIYLHVPAAWISLFAGVVMGGLNTLAWVYHLHVADMLAHQSARIGLAATLVALITGSIWGSMTWGTWWVWDMRLTTELLLALLYIAYLTAVHAVQMRLLSKRIQFIISLLVMINIPVIHWSVKWWNSLHQPSTLLALGQETMPKVMYQPLMLLLLVVTAGCIWFVSGQFILRYSKRFQNEALPTTP